MGEMAVISCVSGGSAPTVGDSLNLAVLAFATELIKVRDWVTSVARALASLRGGRGWWDEQHSRA